MILVHLSPCNEHSIYIHTTTNNHSHKLLHTKDIQSDQVNIYTKLEPDMITELLEYQYKKEQAALNLFNNTNSISPNNHQSQPTNNTPLSLSSVGHFLFAKWSVIHQSSERIRINNNQKPDKSTHLTYHPFLKQDMQLCSGKAISDALQCLCLERGVTDIRTFLRNGCQQLVDGGYIACASPAQYVHQNRHTNHVFNDHHMYGFCDAMYRTFVAQTYC